MQVIEREHILSYLQERQLVSQYKKVKSFIENGSYALVQLKKRQPTSANIWYFRINKKYRAWAFKHNDTLAVFKIDDHQ